MLFRSVSVAGSPYLALYQMRDAIAREDYDVLNEYIDYDALRENLKGQFTVQVTEEMSRDSKYRKGPLGGGAATLLVATLVGRLVDVFVQPHVIEILLRNGTALDPPRRSRGTVPLQPRIESGYDGMNRFVVAFVRGNRSEDTTRLVLRRQWLFVWKVTSISVDARAFVRSLESP